MLGMGYYLGGIFFYVVRWVVSCGSLFRIWKCS